MTNLPNSSKPKANKSSRSEIAKALKIATVSYLVRKGYACYEELGLSKWGKRRGDVVGLSTKRKLFVAECKSVVSDFTSDSKWQEYLPLCDQLAFVFTHTTWAHPKIQAQRAAFREFGVGVLILDPHTGYLKSAMPAKVRKIEGIVRRDIIVRMAWRNGTSRRNFRRQRQFLIL